MKKTNQVQINEVSMDSTIVELPCSGLFVFSGFNLIGFS